MSTLVERRRHTPHDRQHVVTIAALWGALTLLAATAALLQPAEPVELPAPPPLPVVAAHLAPPAQKLPPGSFIGTVPNAPDPVGDETPPSF